MSRRLRRISTSILRGRLTAGLSLAITFLLLSTAAWAREGRPVPADGGPTEVEIGIYMLDLDGVENSEQSFQANVYWTAVWSDPRLSHPGPQTKVVPLSEAWHPGIQVLNQQKVWATFPEELEVSPDGKVEMRQRIWGNFSQPLKLKNFPFDTQTLSVQLVTSGIKQDGIVVKPAAISGISETLSIADWQVLGVKTEGFDFQFAAKDNRKVKGLALNIEIKRQSGYFVTKVIFPLVLIVAMSWIVFWVDPTDYGTQISVAVTAMLTLIAYRFAADSNLPPISYLTRLDHFIFSSTVLVFFTLVVVVLTSTMVRAENIQRARRVDRIAKVLFPAVFLIVSIVSLLL